MLNCVDCIAFLTNSLQNFDKHIQGFYKLPDFKKISEEAQPFFKAVKDYVFGRPANLENIVRWFPVSLFTDNWTLRTVFGGA